MRRGGEKTIILIDDRIGSKHLAVLIGPKAELTRLDFGDAAFSASDGRLVGIEVKKVSDAVQCMYTGRLADHQIPGMKQSFDFCYLVIEGVYRPDPESGVLQLWREFDSTKPVKCGQWHDVTSGRKRLMYQAFEMWLTSIERMGGVSLRVTPSSAATASLLTSLYSWWQRDDHHSFDTLHQAEGVGASLSRPSMLRRMLALLPHVGWQRSAELAQRVRGVKFVRKDGEIMSERDWHIPREIAAQSSLDIDRACDGQAD